MTNNQSSVVVVGGAGFIGSHVVELLLAQGDRVTVIDDMSHPSPVALPDSADVVVADGGSPEAAQTLQQIRPDTVIHLAAKGGVNKALRDPGAHVRAVLASSVGCFDAAYRAGCKRIVIASSGGAVYGDPRQLPASEDLQPAPRSAYGVGKLCEEAYLATYRDQGMTTLALRYGNVYGPRQDGTGEAGLVAITAWRLADGLNPIVYGDGLQTRDFVYVGDVARATVAAARASHSGAVNVGTGVGTAINDVVTQLISINGADDMVIDRQPQRPGEVRDVRLDPSRAAEWLGWHAETDLSSGLRAASDYFAHQSRPALRG